MPTEICADSISIQNAFSSASYFDIAQAATAVMALLIAIYTIYNHAKYLKKSKTAEMLLPLNDNQHLFESIDAIHKMHLSGKNISQLADRRFVDGVEAKSVRHALNHFERISACVEEGIYNERLIAKTQGSRIIKLHKITEPYISKIRIETDSKLAYRNFEILAKRMRNLT